MFKRFLIVGAIAFMPIAAFADATPDNTGTHTVYVQAGQGYGLTLTIPDNPQTIEAPYALTGTSASDTPQDYRNFQYGQGGVLRFESQ